MKRKNVVIVHLESLSNTILSQQREKMPFLNSLSEKAMNFSNFVTSATSSIMAFTDFCYGNDYELDLSTNVDSDLKISYLENNFFKILEDNNYLVRGIGYPEGWRDDINGHNLWNLNEPYDYSSKTEDQFFSCIESTVRQAQVDNKPLALHIWDLRSHLHYIDETKASKRNFFDRRDYGYYAIDKTFKYVYELLEKENLIEDTLIVAYGDHGDELWSHNLNGGFCHSFEPYTTLVHTPCLLIDSNIPKGINHSLTSLIDLKWIILDHLGIECSKNFDKTGQNIMEISRQYCFSRNLLANQSSKVNGILRKSYSVTNENYHLIVSPFGLELYMHKYDPYNTFNVLNLFTVNDEGELVDFDHRGAYHTHFRNTFFNGHIEHVKENFKEMYAQLYKYVEDKNNYVVEHDGENIFRLFNFKRIKQQGTYQWNA